MDKLLHWIEAWVDAYIAHRPRAKPRGIDAKSVCLVAHRGAHDASLSIQENTHPAFQRALALGCYGIELDVHSTADGILVVNHDPDLKRLWGHDAAIRSLSWLELKKRAPNLPTLAEVIEQYGRRMHLFIELKTPFDAVEPLAELLKHLKPGEDYHLISLDASIFLQLQPFPPSALLLVPVHNNIHSMCQLSMEKHYAGVLSHYLLLRNRDLRQLQQAGQWVGVGFVDSRYSLYRELYRGIRLLFTNKAAVVAASIADLKQ